MEKTEQDRLFKISEEMRQLVEQVGVLLVKIANLRREATEIIGDGVGDRKIQKT